MKFTDLLERQFINPPLELSPDAEYKKEFIVIGGGLMGATIAKALWEKGLDGEILDSKEEEPGTVACGGLIKPSPLMGMTKEQVNASLAMLDRFFGIQAGPIKIRPSGNILKTTVYEVGMDEIFSVPKVWGKALEIKVSPNSVLYWNKAKKLIQVFAPLIVLAAGRGCLSLAPRLQDSLTAKRGFSFHFSGSVPEPFVKFWAPYKQITIHNTVFKEEPIVWAGEGSALKLNSWYDGKIEEGLARVRGEIPKLELIRTLRGIRLFHPKRKPCYLEHTDEGVHIATACGKFGLISAGFAAIEVLKNEGL